MTSFFFFPNFVGVFLNALIRCGNVASILELNDQLQQEYKVFSHAPLVRLLKFDSSPNSISYSPFLCSERAFYPGQTAATRILFVMLSRRRKKGHPMRLSISFVPNDTSDSIFYLRSYVFLVVTQKNAQLPVVLTQTCKRGIIMSSSKTTQTVSGILQNNINVDTPNKIV